MANDQQPPPVVPDPNSGAHLHRRREDNSSPPRAHRRWYDSTKIQIAAVTALLTFGIGAFSSGVALRDWLRGIEATGLQIMELEASHAEMWAAINRNQTNVDDMKETLDQMFCHIYIEDVTERQRCVNDQTRRRIRSMTQQQRGVSP